MEAPYIFGLSRLQPAVSFHLRHAGNFIHSHIIQKKLLYIKVKLSL
jgi:hypothetical protein